MQTDDEPALGWTPVLRRRPVHLGSVQQRKELKERPPLLRQAQHLLG